LTVWHWVRHGPTHARNFVGWRDVPADLSDLPLIDRLRRALPDDAVLISSDLSRARDTAEAIREEGHLRLADDPHLREMHFGQWDGLHFDDVSARDPDLSLRFWDDPGDVRAPGGESWNDASARVAAAVARIGARHPGRHIIAVAHFGVILTQVQRALGVPPREALAQRIDNFSITTIDSSGLGPRLVRVNHVP
jgi:broad specificity phosphatase PhoE